MKRIGPLSMTVAVALLAGGILAPPVHALKQAIPQIDLDTPFVLRAGEMMRVRPEGFEVTLRTISEDSGCLAPDDCSVMLFKGTLVFRLGEQRELLELNASFKPDAPVSMDYAGYKLWLTAVHRVKGRFEASFKVIKAEEKKEDGEGEP
jgi:hypothetical protein